MNTIHVTAVLIGGLLLTAAAGDSAAESIKKGKAALEAGKAEDATRNHRCHTMDELLDRTFDWFETRAHFRVQSSIYSETPCK